MTTTFIQWKGTDLCMDFYCPECNEHSHFDGMFAYHIRCPYCRTVFQMPTDVGVKKLDGWDRERDGCLLESIDVVERLEKT